MSPLTTFRGDKCGRVSPQDWGWCGWPGAVGQVEQAEGAFLLEVQGLDGWGRDAAEAAAQLGYFGPDPLVAEHPQAERQFRWADVQPPLDVQAQGHRSQVVLTELAVSWAAGRLGPGGPPPGGRLTDRRQQAEQLPVPQHSRRRSELLGGGRDTHGR
jgi:hypothetical protein